MKKPESVSGPIAGLLVLLSYVIGVVFTAAVLGAWRLIPEVIKHVS